MGKYTVGPAEVWLADCVDVARYYPDDYFQLLLTSTPYPGLAGFNKTPDQYIWWWRKRLWEWLPKMDQRYGVIVQVVKYPRTKDGQFDAQIFDLITLYKRRNLFFIDLFPWVKPNAPPAGNHARYDRDAYEFCLVFGMSDDYTYNKLRKDYATKTVKKAASGNLRKPDVRGSLSGGHANLHPDGATLDNVLRISSTGGKEQTRRRVAGGVFPMELADRFILEFSNVQDKVIDPFCGSGTVLARSLVHGRVPVGVDIDIDAVSATREWCKEVLEEPVQEVLV